MPRPSAVVSGAVVLLITGCATIPSGPSVMVLPGAGKGFEQFQADDAVCRQWALQQTGTTPKKVAGESTVTGAAVGTVLGAALGAAIGAAAGSPATGAAVGAGAGLLGGTAIGASNAEGASISVQRRYDKGRGHYIPTTCYSGSPGTPVAGRETGLVSPYGQLEEASMRGLGPVVAVGLAVAGCATMQDRLNPRGKFSGSFPSAAAQFHRGLILFGRG